RLPTVRVLPRVRRDPRSAVQQRTPGDVASPNDPARASSLASTGEKTHSAARTHRRRTPGLGHEYLRGPGPTNRPGRHRSTGARAAQFGRAETGRSARMTNRDTVRPRGSRSYHRGANRGAAARSAQRASLVVIATRGKPLEDFFALGAYWRVRLRPLGHRKDLTAQGDNIGSRDRALGDLVLLDVVEHLRPIVGGLFLGI